MMTLMKKKLLNLQEETSTCLNICKPTVNKKRTRPKTYAGPPSKSLTQIGNGFIPRNGLPEDKGKYKTDSEKSLILSPDFVRSFKVISREPKKVPVAILKADFERIKSASHVVPKEVKDAILKKKIIENEKKLLGVQERRASFRALDKNKMKTSLPDYEREAKAHAEALKVRVENLRKEGEEEIRYLNTMILEAKGTTLLHRQVIEKKSIENVIKEEDKRLDQLIEEERKAEFERQHEEELKTKELRKKYRLLLQQQMKENLDNQIREEEQKLVEQQLILENMKAYMEEQPKIMQMKKEKQKQLKEGLDLSMEYIMQQMLEEEWMEKMTAQEAENFQKMREERIRKFNEKKKHLEELKEADRLKLHANYKQAMDSKADQIEIIQRRYQEAKEREMREKEKKELEEKIKKRKELQTMQDELLEMKERKIAMEIQQNREEFTRILRLQKESFAKEKERELKIKEAKKEFCQQQVKEIIEIEKRHIQERSKAFADSIKAEKEKEQLIKDLRDLKQKKLKDLSETCPDIPKQYLQHIDKKVQIIDPPKMIFEQSALDKIFTR